MYEMYMYLMEFMSIYDQEKKKKSFLTLTSSYSTFDGTISNRQTSNKNHNSEVTLVFINQ